MSLKLYYHPLSSFCWKPLIALYEKEIVFTPQLVDLGDERSRAELFQVWPMGQFPVLKDDRSKKIIPQSAAIIEYLERSYTGGPKLVPEDADSALEARRWDSFCDASLQVPMQKIVGDCLRPTGAKDPHGVNDAREILIRAYGVLENHLAQKTWMIGDDFSMADCAAAPALYYGDIVEPLGPAQPGLSAYLARLEQRPSFARVLREAAPYFSMFPYRK
ncbi:MAG: glutathione S-transferase family protein [Proteobacteria bacterium]|nr:MAG: glutathione S-transferase family protein [Pseudomonadota bacterium]